MAEVALALSAFRIGCHRQARDSRRMAVPTDKPIRRGNYSDSVRGGAVDVEVGGHVSVGKICHLSLKDAGEEVRCECLEA